MKDNSNVNNYFNNNGKRSNGIFNTPGGESTNFANRLLKTTIPNQGNEDSDLQDREDVEDEEQLQTLFFAEEDNAVLYSRLNDSIKVWKANQAYEPLIHKQQLLYYNIIDTSLDASPLPNKDLNSITKMDMPVYITPSLTEPPKVNLNSCNSFSSLKKLYDEDKQNMPYINSCLLQVLP